MVNIHMSNSPDLSARLLAVLVHAVLKLHASYVSMEVHCLYTCTHHLLHVVHMCILYCVGCTCYVDLYNMQFCCTYLCRSKGCCLAVELFCTGILPNLWVLHMCIIISMALNWNAPTLFHTRFEQATGRSILGTTTYVGVCYVSLVLLCDCAAMPFHVLGLFCWLGQPCTLELQHL